jgi:hypothetical protein
VPAAATLAWTLELWGQAYGAGHAWPAARVASWIAQGAWVWQLVGFGVLCLVFPGGLLPGRRWRAMLVLFLAAALGVQVVLALAQAVVAPDATAEVTPPRRGWPPSPWQVSPCSSRSPSAWRPSWSATGAVTT